MKQDAKAIRQWKREHVDFMQFEARKEINLPDRIAAAVAAGKAASRQAYIIAAVEKALQADGFPAAATADADDH